MSFNYLKRHEPKNRTAEYVLPIRGALDENGEEMVPKLFVRYAGESNRAWNNAVLKANAKTGLARKAVTGSMDTNRIANERDRELYPKHIVFGWSGIPDDERKPVPFSQTNCEQFIVALPQWLFDDARIWCSTVQNFLEGDDVDDDHIEETAGN